MDSSLRGLHIVVTRPKHQAEELSRQLVARGAQVIAFPVLAIEALDNNQVLKLVNDENTPFDLVIFVSPNAVEHGLNPIQTQGLLASHTEIAAVGKGSSRALQNVGIHVQVIPEQRFDSESLLALPRLNTVTGQSIAIVKGEGGRELIAETLRQRGALVTEIPCYRRVKPDSDPQILRQHWQNHSLDLIIVTSNEGLTNLLELVGPQSRQALLNTQLIVLSQRAVELAEQMGFQRTPLVAALASDSGLVEAVESWRRSQPVEKG